MIRYKMAILKISLNLFLTIVLVVIYPGCLKNNVTEPLNLSFNSTEEIVHYLEANGNYINSKENPSTIDVADVNANLSDYLLLDIRSSDEFNSGHIGSALNVMHSDLLKILDTLVINQNSKIVIISKNGQSASYYTSILRLCGYNKVYAMKFGMAAWHLDFSLDWQLAMRPFDRSKDFSSEINEKDDYYSLPEFPVAAAGLTIEERIKKRAIDLLNEDFPEINISDIESVPAIDRKILLNRLRILGNLDYVICIGERDSYVYNDKSGLAIQHFKRAVYYSSPEPADLNSSRYLQTIPIDRKIILYSCDGSLSAFYTAYLRFLGYNASSLLFGLNSLYPNEMTQIPSLFEDSFKASPVYNFPYVK